jgi:molybdopterin synthase sulfur carrier subunit
VNIRILYFARLRELLGLASEQVTLPAGVATTGALLAWLRGRGGAWGEHLAEGRAFRMAVNQDMADSETPLHAGDEVAIFPPVTGG